MTTTAQSVIQRAQDVLQDVAGVRWPATELARYFNDGQRALITLRPDQGSATAAFVPVAGARQTIPATSISLIAIQGNTSGTKRAVRPVDGAMLDAFNRDWRAMTGVTEYANYVYDPRDPRTFWLYPPSSGGGSIDLTTSVYPTDIAVPGGAAYTTVTGNMSIPDIWDNTLLNYILARAYTKDAEFGGNAQLSGAYMQAFSTGAVVQLKASITVAPKPR